MAVNAERLISIQKFAGSISSLLGRDSALIRAARPAYEAFLERASGRAGIPWTLNGIPVRIDPRYRHQLGRDYEAPVARFLRTLVKPDWCCFDIGANVGAYVLQLGYWLSAKGRIIAFEPNAAARDVLHRHIAMNGLGCRVEVEPAAVGDRTSSATLYFHKADGMSRLGSPNRALERAVSAMEVPVEALDDYCERMGFAPNLLLIDIEGSEFNALSGARKLIGTRRGMEIVVEMHPMHWASAGWNRSTGEALLRELGAECEPLTGQRDPLGEYGVVRLRQ